jgi:hypothetical protein
MNYKTGLFRLWIVFSAVFLVIGGYSAIQEVGPRTYYATSLTSFDECGPWCDYMKGGVHAGENDWVPVRSTTVSQYLGLFARDSLRYEKNATDDENRKLLEVFDSQQGWRLFARTFWPILLSLMASLTLLIAGYVLMWVGRGFRAVG